MRIRKLTFFFLCCMPLFSMAADDITFTANVTASVVHVGEQFRLVYTVNERSSDFKYPTMEHFQILSGPNSSSNTSFQWVNGKSSQSISTTYTFYLSANEPGEFTIPPATVTVNRKTYTSNSVTIKVVPRNTNSGGSQGATQQGGSTQQGVTGGGQSGNSQNNQQTAQASVSASGDVFVSGSASKKNVYVGEQFVFTNSIYSKLDLSGFGDVKFPAYTGFWKEDIDIGNVSLHRVSVDNEIYNAGEIQKCVLFPHKSGDIVIDPAEVEVVARVRQRGGSGMGDPFFDSFFQTYQNVRYNCKSKPVTIHVNPLPTEGRPGSFSGAVGNYTMNSSIDKTSLMANEAITIRFTISGSGNVKMIDKLNIKFPYDFEVYEPKITQNSKVNNDIVSGTKVFEYVVIPRNSGDFRIEPFEFSFFNPSKKEYVTLTSPEFEVHVEGRGTELQEVERGVEREDVVSLAEDIRYIKTKTPKFGKSSSQFFASANYFILLGLLSVMTVLAIVLINRMIAKRSDVEGIKRRRAEGVAMKRLKKAKGYLDAKEPDKFYDEVSNALWSYLGDRFNLPYSELNRDFLNKLAEEGKISKEDADKFISVINDAEFARFSPGTPTDSMNEIYSEAVEVIKLFYSKLK